jgi:hypothetical protein
MHWPFIVFLIIPLVLGHTQWCSMDDYCQAQVPQLASYPAVTGDKLRLVQVIAIVRHGDRTP